VSAIVSRYEASMKVTLPVSVVCAIAIYAATYLYVRTTFRSTGAIFRPNPNGSGYLPPVAYTNTEIWIPGLGKQRWIRYGLFFLFRPAGYIDEHITGRGYRRTDERYIEY